MKTERWIVIPGSMTAGWISVCCRLDRAYPSPAASPKGPRPFLQDTETQAELDRYWRESLRGSERLMANSPFAASATLLRPAAAKIDEAIVGD